MSTLALRPLRRRYFRSPHVLFRWRAGLPFPAGATYSRSSPAWYIGADGLLRQAAANVPRIDWSHGRPALRLEPARTNLVAWSSQLSKWTKGGTPTVTDDAIAFGALSLALVRDPTAGVLNYVLLPVTFTGDGQRCVSVYLAQGPNPSPTGTHIVLRDGIAGVDRLRARVTWSAGAPAVTMITGTQITAPEHVRQGIYRLQFRSTAVTAANSHTVQIEPAREGETGDVYAGGVQVENAVVPSSLIVTEGAGTAQIRQADSLYFPLPPALSRPAPFTVYVRWIAHYDGDGGLVSPGMIRIGGPNLNGTAIIIFTQAGSGNIRAAHYNGTGQSVHATTSIVPAAGDLMEAMLTFGADGSGVLVAAANGGTPAWGNLPALAPAAQWTLARAYLNAGNVTGAGDYLDLLLLRGASWTMDQIREVVGV